MLDVREKKVVTTRKNHKCYFCGEEIAKGVQAISVKGKEDSRYINLYLHIPCNIAANKIDLFDENLQQSAAPMKDFSIAPETDFPFE